jgi:hypothetical protein
LLEINIIDSYNFIKKSREPMGINIDTFEDLVQYFNRFSDNLNRFSDNTVEPDLELLPPPLGLVDLEDLNQEPIPDPDPDMPPLEEETRRLY